MHDGVKTARQDSVQHCAIAHVAVHKIAAQHGVSVACRQIVERGDTAALLAEHLHHVRADVAGTTYYQDFGHLRSLSWGLGFILSSAGFLNACAQALA